MSDLNADPYRLQRADERKAAMKERLRRQAGKGPSRAKAQREPVTSIAKVMQDRDRKNSRKKGSKGELDVAKLFSKWCGEVVRRTPQSGGWSNAKFGVTADLVCSNKAFPFHVEVKHREGWVLDDLVTGVRKEHDKSVLRWWFQCLDSCPKITGKHGYTKLKKIPLLVFRRNRQPWLVMMMANVPIYCGPQSACFILSDEHYDDHEVVVMLLEDFLAREPAHKGLKNYRGYR